MKKPLIFIVILMVLIILGFYFYFKNPLFEKNNQDAADEVDVFMPSNNDIFGDWIWQKSIDSSKKEVFPQDSSKFVLSLTPEGKLNSTTDCNLVNGSFVKNDEFIAFSSLTATEMDCGGNNMEVFYMSSLAVVSSYSILDNVLTLNLAKDSGTMIFQKREI